VSPPESQQPLQASLEVADTSCGPIPPTYKDTNTTDADPRRARVEDNVDDNTGGGPEAGDMAGYWLWDYPEGPAGEILRTSNLTGTGSCFENIRHRQRLAGKAPWDPFINEEEWELAQWLVETGVSQRNIDRFLKLKKVVMIFTVFPHSFLSPRRSRSNHDMSSSLSSYLILSFLPFILSFRSHDEGHTYIWTSLQLQIKVKAIRTSRSILPIGPPLPLRRYPHEESRQCPFIIGVQLPLLRWRDHRLGSRSLLCQNNQATHSSLILLTG